MSDSRPFGNYLLLDRISRGGMAEIWRARPRDGANAVVALKRMLPGSAENEELLRMFLEEAKLLAQLSHPNIARIFDSGKVGGEYYIALEYLAGKDLRTLHNRAQQLGMSLPIPLLALAMSRLCAALDYAHRKTDERGRPLQIVHRDVAPDNCLVTFDGEVKLIDFGVAKSSEQQARTRAGVLKGKLAYMSPEQVREKPLDRRSDLFALGAVFHELLTGRRLFLGSGDFETLNKVLRAPIPRPSELNPGVPAALDQIVLRALQRDPERRFQWASEMGQALEAFLARLAPAPSAIHLQKLMAVLFAEDLDKERQLRKAWRDSKELELPILAGEVEPEELAAEVVDDEMIVGELDQGEHVGRSAIASRLPEMVVPELLRLPSKEELPPPLPSPEPTPVPFPGYQATSTPPSHFELPPAPGFRPSALGVQLANTRRWRRWPVSIKVRGRWWSVPGDDRPLAAVVCSLSEGGAMLRCREPIRANSTVELTVPTGWFSRVRVRGDVRWWSRAGQDCQVGLEFAEVRPELARFLERRHQ